MSTATPARPVARQRPDRLAFKTAEDLSGQVLDWDLAEGIVTAIVSVTGTEDEVGDIIVPGAYRETLTKRNPKVCWAHAWERPVGRTLAAEELMPGDPRLPSETKEGNPWPKEAGALLATLQFNLRTAEGKDAFEAVIFYSETGECEYSIGYQVPPGKAAQKNGVRYIKSLELYELSVVLFGAHTMTGTLSIKAALSVKAVAQATGQQTKRLLSPQIKAAESHTPPQGVRSNAQRGLDLRKANGGKGGTEVGVARARNLANGDGIPLSTIRRMASFFARHEVDKSADGWGSTSDPSPGYIAWLLWGGDAGKTWAEGIARKNNTDGKAAAPSGSATAALDALIEGKAKAPPFTPKGGADDGAKPAPADDDEPTQVKPTVTARDDLPAHDADTNLTTEDCPCGDLLVFDTSNGWQRLDGSYSHDDGTTHSDWILPPEDVADASEPDAQPGTALGDGKAPAAAPGETKPDEQSASATGDGKAPATPPKPDALGGGTEDGTEGGAAGKAPDFTDGIMVAVYPDPQAADAIAAAIAGPDTTTERDDLHVTLAFLGNVGEVDLTSDEIIRRLTDALEGENGLRGTVGGIGMFPADEDSENGPATWVPVDVPGLSLLRENIVNALGEDAVSDSHGFTPHMTIGWDLGVIDPLPSIPIKFTEVRIVYGDQSRTLALGTVPGDDDEEDWEGKSAPGARKSSDFKPCAKCGSTKVSDLSGSKQPKCANCGFHLAIKDEVKVLDLDGLTESEIGSLTAAFARFDPFGLTEAKAEGGADRNRGGAEELRRYWTTGEGGVKIGWNTDGDFTRCVALLEEHMPGRAEGYCANRHKEMTGMWPGDKGNKAAYDPTLDAPTAHRGGAVYSIDPEAKMYPHMAGSREESDAWVSQAVNEALRGEEVEEGRFEWDHVSIDATFADHLYATRINFDGGTDDRETWTMTYAITPGGVELGLPERAELAVVAVDAHDHDTDDHPLALMPVAESLATIAGYVKAATPDMEVKAGRVLSGKNERELRSVVENLVAVLARAGVRVQIVETEDDVPATHDNGQDRPSDRATPVDPRIDPTTTAPASSVKSHPALRGGDLGTSPEGETMLTMDDVSEALARLREGL